MRFYQEWRERRAEAAAERKRVERLFLEFVEDARTTAPRAKKHPEAALYRHAWKRAAVLEIIYQRHSYQELALLHRAFRDLASKQYYMVAPSGRYGRPPLRMEGPAASRLLEKEQGRLFPAERKNDEGRVPDSKPCIYAGRSDDGRVYVGQTREEPERRWLHHHVDGTGPYRSGDQYVDWEVIERDVPAAKLDEREAYWIGMLDAFENGYNENRGNAPGAYDRGCADRRASTGSG